MKGPDENITKSGRGSKACRHTNMRPMLALLSLFDSQKPGLQADEKYMLIGFLMATGELVESPGSNHCYNFIRHCTFIFLVVVSTFTLLAILLPLDVGKAPLKFPKANRLLTIPQ